MMETRCWVISILVDLSSNEKVTLTRGSPKLASSTFKDACCCQEGLSLLEFLWHPAEQKWFGKTWIKKGEDTGDCYIPGAMTFRTAISVTIYHTDSVQRTGWMNQHYACDCWQVGTSLASTLPRFPRFGDQDRCGSTVPHRNGAMQESDFWNVKINWFRHLKISYMDSVTHSKPEAILKKVGLAIACRLLFWHVGPNI